MTHFLDFTLPPHLIAQHPVEQRDQARLLVACRAERSLSHHVFADLPELLSPGDLLILNDTRVVPARLLGRRGRTGGKWQGLFLRQREDGAWEMLCQTRGRLTPGEVIEIDPGPLELTLEARAEKGIWLARPRSTEPTLVLLARHGQVPLPPYIRKGRAAPDDVERYQTVFARQPGAVAAPTAGLHFTPEVFAALQARGIAWSQVTLHVGWGTFQPMESTDPAQHHIHQEWGELPETTVQAIADCRARGGKVVAVGTTAVRVLETVASQGPLRAWRGETALFIYPPYTFHCVDALITNFHLPRTTLLLLVAAFAGEDLLRSAYAEAIAREYRFYSYGDAMLVL